jgi:hypothetical protein
MPPLAAARSMDAVDDESPAVALARAIRVWNQRTTRALINAWFALSVAFVACARRLSYASLPLGVLGIAASALYAFPSVRGRSGAIGAMVTLKVMSACCASADAACAVVTAVVLAARASARAAGVGALAATCVMYAAHGAVSVCVYARAKEVCDVITSRDRVENDAR